MFGQFFVDSFKAFGAVGLCVQVEDVCGVVGHLRFHSASLPLSSLSFVSRVLLDLKPRSIEALLFTKALF